MEDRFNRALLFKRLRILGVVFAAFFLFLTERLWNVQVRQGEKFTRSIENQCIRKIHMSAARGRILASDEQTVLADNKPEYHAVFHVGEMRQAGGRSKTISFILDQAKQIGSLINKKSTLTREMLINHYFYIYPALPLPLFRTPLTMKQVALLSEAQPPFAGLEITVDIVRTYPHPCLASQIIGTGGKQKPFDEFESKNFSYIRNEVHGWRGLERLYDNELSGSWGARFVRVTPSGFIKEEIGVLKTPERGNDLVLTLDYLAQSIASKLMMDRRGAFVLLKVDTAEVLAMYSTPTFDLSMCEENYNTRSDYFDRISENPFKPDLNRCISETFLPGSIIKPLIAGAILENKIADINSTHVCEGRYKIGNSSIGCHNKLGHGELNIVHAIEQSCNPFFNHFGIKTGLDNIRPVLLSSGLGEKTGIDLPRETSGHVPSREWARQHPNRGPWGTFDTALLSMGQGDVNMTPLQAARYIAAIANGGKVYSPYIVQKILSPDGDIIRENSPELKQRLAISQENLDIIRRGMSEVVNGKNASGNKAKNTVISLAGKTGTAEVGSGENKRENTWFVCFGPIENPRYALAILVEDGESGGRTCAPIAGKFFEQWLGAR